MDGMSLRIKTGKKQAAKTNFYMCFCCSLEWQAAVVAAAAAANRSIARFYGRVMTENGICNAKSLSKQIFRLVLEVICVGQKWRMKKKK